MLISYKLAQGSIILRFKIRRSDTGLGYTGLSSSTSGFTISTIADTEASPVSYVAGSTLQTIPTLGTYLAPSSGQARIRKIDDTLHPGVVELQLADTRYAVAGAKSLLITWSGASNMLDGDVCVPLTAVDPYSATAFVTSVTVGAYGSGLDPATQILVSPSHKIASDASGFLTVAPAGLDQITIETGLDARQSLQIMASALAGVVSGAGTGTIVFKGAGVDTTRITGSTDGTGNRTAVALNPS
jgi:hypothetical protein